MKISNYQVSFNFDKESVSRINWRPFFAGIIATVVIKVMMALPLAQAAMFLSPIPANMNVFDSVKPKLEQKVNDFQINKPASFIPVAHAASNADNATAYAVVDLDTGELLAQKNGDERLPIASITKVMTAVVALDLANENEIITITQNAANQVPTKIGIVPGQKMTLEELLNASLLTSANDATEAIKDGINAKYGDEVFIKAMNEKAKFIGLKNTNFTNVEGFDNADHYSSPEDLAILAHYAMTKYPKIAEIVKKDYQFLSADNNHKQFDLYNWNGLLGVYPNVYGIKIGNTEAAGVTTMVASQRGGKNIAVILLGAPGVLERDLWTAELLDVGYEKASGLEPVDVTEEELRAKYGTWKFWN